MNSEGENCHCGKLHLPFAAAAARKAAPQATQIADRFHIYKNLTEAVELTLARCRAEIRKGAFDALSEEEKKGMEELY